LVEIEIICNSGEKLSQRKSPTKRLFLVAWHGHLQNILNRLET